MPKTITKTLVYAPLTGEVLDNGSVQRGGYVPYDPSTHTADDDPDALKIEVNFDAGGQVFHLPATWSREDVENTIQSEADAYDAAAATVKIGDSPPSAFASVVAAAMTIVDEVS